MRSRNSTIALALGIVLGAGSDLTSAQRDDRVEVIVSRLDNYEIVLFEYAE